MSEVCEPSLETPPEMAEVPVVPSFEPADICLNMDQSSRDHLPRFTYDPRPRPPRPLPGRLGASPAPSGSFFCFCFL